MHDQGDGNILTDILETAFDLATNKLSFNTNKFSTYALVYINIEKKQDSIKYDTGYTTAVLLLASMALVSMYSFIILKKKEC